MKRQIFPRSKFKKAHKKKEQKDPFAESRDELKAILEDWEKKALKILEESGLHENNMQWFNYQPQDIQDDRALEARLVLETLKNTREVLHGSENRYLLVLASIKLGIAAASAHALDFETDVIENRNLKIKSQAGRHKSDRESREVCRTLAKSIWDANRKNGEDYIRLGEMTKLLSNHLKDKGLYYPKKLETIREWLKSDPKYGEKELLIPLEASKPGAPRKTTTS